MFRKLVVSVALAAASITMVKAEINVGADGIIHLTGADALNTDYASIQSARLTAAQGLSSSSNATSSLDISGKASASDVAATAEVPLNSDGTINLDAWNNATETACQTALSGVSVASNPSGMGICYNLPALNSTTGVFTADLRLYKLSAASGDFAGVATSNIQVQLSYSGASVSSVNTTNTTDASTAAKLRIRELDSMDQEDIRLSRRASGATMVKQYMLIGQIDTTKMTSNMSMASLEALVIPTLTLDGTTTTGTISTNVSSNEALFVNGIFSREVVMSDLQIATAAVNDIHAALANGTVAFVLPGIRLMTYPVGLIITGTWMMVGFIAYGIGTYDRFMWAQQYRRQIAAVQSSGKQTF